MKIKYNRRCPIVVSPNAEWPGGKAFKENDYGKIVEVSEKFGSRLIKQGFFIEVKQTRKREEVKIIEELDNGNRSI